MTKVLFSIFTVLSYLIMFSYWSLGGVSYLWSLYIAYQESGIMGSVITLFLPVIGQAYWVYKVWSDQGFDSMFVFISVAAVVTYIISLLLMYFLASISKVYLKEDEGKKDIFIYGFGGWLYLFTFGQLYAGYQILTSTDDFFYLISSEELTTLRQNDYADIADRFVAMGLIGLLFILILIVSTLLTWFFAIKVSRLYKTFCISYILVNTVGALILSAYMYYLNQYTDESIYEMSVIITPIYQAIVYTAIWIPYFKVSKRVANTFTK